MMDGTSSIETCVKRAEITIAEFLVCNNNQPGINTVAPTSSTGLTIDIQWKNGIEPNLIEFHLPLIFLNFKSLSQWIGWLQ